MKKGLCLFISVLLVGILSGCGSDSNPEKAEKETDQIEKIGAASSAIGYDGKAIEDQLREVEGLKKDQDKELEKVFEE